MSGEEYEGKIKPTAGPFKKASDASGGTARMYAQAVSKNKENTKSERGMAGDPLDEPVQEFIQCSTDKVIKNNNNAWIVLGRDRPSARISGFGGRGDTQSAAIDIVVGRLACLGPSMSITNDGEKVWVNPDFKFDAARIYISQKTDIDGALDIAEGKVGSPKPRSGIALKADAVRLIGREGIKLVTRTDNLNSQGGFINGIRGIDLIAGNDDKDLQPMVKGKNLVTCFKRLCLHVNELCGIVDSLLTHQTSFNKAITSHFHVSPFFGQATTTSPPVELAGKKTMTDHLSQTKQSIEWWKSNIENFQFEFFSDIGSKYINSRYNHTN